MNKNTKKQLISILIFLVTLGFICISSGRGIGYFFQLALVALSAHAIVNIVRNKFAKKKDETNAAEDSDPGKSSSYSKKKIIYIAIALIVLLSFIFSGGFSSSGRSSSKKSSSNKSYHEQYGYDVEDFYYQGSNGLWYKK